MANVFLRRFLTGLLLASLLMGAAVQAMQGTAMAFPMAPVIGADMSMLGCGGCANDVSTHAGCPVWSCAGWAAIASEPLVINLPSIESLTDQTLVLRTDESPGSDPRPAQGLSYA